MREKHCCHKSGTSDYLAGMFKAQIPFMFFKIFLERFCHNMSDNVIRHSESTNHLLSSLNVETLMCGGG